MFTALNIEYLIYGALPVYSYIKNGSNDLIVMIVVDKTEDDIYKVTFAAYSSNNGDISTFIFCRAYCIINIKQWESKRIITTILLQPCVWVTYQQAHIYHKRHDEVDNHPF